MITKVGVKNFKLFKDEINLELKPITILTGANNSGKSTFINFVKFLFLAYELEYDSDYFGGERGYIIKNFGSLSEILSKGTINKSLTFSFTYLANHLIA